jgi:organic radical activating enzyme
MFGQNKVVKQNLKHPDALNVKKIFYTIQGEGPYAGQVAVFVRLAYCNLRCTFCDTDFESDIQVMSVSTIVDEVRRLQPGGLVVLSGGEPLLQDISMLCRALHACGFRIQVETAGTVSVPDLPKYVEIVCSPKTAKIQLAIAVGRTTWKYLIKAGQQSVHDGLPVGLFRPLCGVIYVQPLDEQDPELSHANMVAAVEACLKYGYRLSLQQHKIIGVE